MYTLIWMEKGFTSEIWRLMDGMDKKEGCQGRNAY